MDDFKRFEELLKEGYRCISVVSYEEQYALEIVRAAAMSLSRDMWIWSVSEGVRDGLLKGAPPIPETTKPADGLSNLAGAKPGAICVTLDIAEHLGTGGRALRILRDMIEPFDETGIAVVMIGGEDKLPECIKAYTRPFEISLPDEKKLKDIIGATLHRLRRKKPIEVGISRKGLEAIIRNLRGLTRRQAERVARRLQRPGSVRCFGWIRALFTTAMSAAPNAICERHSSRPR